MSRINLPAASYVRPVLRREDDPQTFAQLAETIELELLHALAGLEVEYETVPSPGDDPAYTRALSSLFAARWICERLASRGFRPPPSLSEAMCRLDEVLGLGVPA